MNFLWSVILFLPLLAALALFGIFYAKKGYKKGPWRALICLGVTLVSGVLSWLGALLLSDLLASSLTGLIAGLVPAGGLMITGFVRVVAGTLAKVLVAIVSFAVLFYILLPVLGALAKLIKVPEWEKKQNGKNTARYVGMGIRIADAVLVALLVMLPLYGLMMVGAGPAAVALGGDVPVLESAAAHPVRYVYQYGPVAPVINSMTRVTVNQHEVDFVDVATAFGQVSEPYAQAVRNGAENNAVQGNVLIDTLNNEVLRRDWCYHFCMQALTEMETLLQQPEFSEKAEMKKGYISAFRMTETEFYACSDPMVQTLASALRFNLQNSLLNPDVEMPELPSAFLERFGTLMNTSEPMVKVKRTILYNGLVYLLTNYGAEEPGERASYILNECFGNGRVPEDYRQQEAMAVILILRAKNVDEMVSAFTQNPMFQNVTLCRECDGTGVTVNYASQIQTCPYCNGIGVDARLPNLEENDN